MQIIQISKWRQLMMKNEMIYSYGKINLTKLSNVMPRINKLYLLF